MRKMILAADLACGIGNSGKVNGLPWNSIPEDFKHFQYESKLMINVIMGTKTFDAILNFSKGKLLPERKIFVISKTLAETPHPDVVLCSSVAETLLLLTAQDFIVCGGKQTYESFLPFVHEIIFTKVHSIFDADCHISPSIFYDFIEDESRGKVLKEATGTFPLVTAHYFVRKTA